MIDLMWAVAGGVTLGMTGFALIACASAIIFAVLLDKHRGALARIDTAAGLAVERARQTAREQNADG